MRATRLTDCDGPRYAVEFMPGFTAIFSTPTPSPETIAALLAVIEAVKALEDPPTHDTRPRS